MIRQVSPSPCSGSVLVPSSKSHTIRALLIASLAEGSSTLLNPLKSNDTLSAAKACRAFGANINMENDGKWVVTGTSGRLQVPDDVVNVGNSGTSLYLAAGAASLIDGWTFFTGDGQIRSRPAGQLLQALNDLGATAFSTRGNSFPPIAVKGRLKGGRTSIECPTSQYLSSLLLAAPLASGKTIIDVPLLHEKPYVEMTLRWLDEQNIRYWQSNLEHFEIQGGQKYTAFDKSIPGDFSSATFFLCAAVSSKSTITVTGLDMEDTQGDKKVVDMLRQMGCEVSVAGDSVTIDGSRAEGCEIDMNATPDALPAMAAAACYAGGVTRLVNVPQARLKETDRIAVMAKELGTLGADVRELEDGLEIRQSVLGGGLVNGHDDHRVVMSLAVAALGAQEPVSIQTAEAASVTFPDFFELLESIRKQA